MDSLGVFYNLNLKKSNDLMATFDQAINQATGLFDTMDGFENKKQFYDNTDNIPNEYINFPKNSKKSVSSNSLNNPLKSKSRKNHLKPINHSKNNYPYSYETELIKEIENLFNPTFKFFDKKKGEMGMSSFLSPLFDSTLKTNLEKRNKNFYNNDISKKNDKNIIGDNVDEKEQNTEKNSQLSEGKQKKFRITHNGFGKRNGFGTYYMERTNSSNSNSNNNFKKKAYKTKYGQKFIGNKQIESEIKELKKNRYFSRTKTNFRKNVIYARDLNNSSRRSSKGESNVDQLINKLKKHYS